MGQKAKDHKIRWIYALLAFLLASAFFFMGFCVRAFTERKAGRTLSWIFNQIQTHYYEDYTERELFDMVTDYINEGILDRYSEYYTAEEYDIIEAQSRGERVGIGVTLTSETDLTVSRVSGNSPAEKAGIQKGDRLLGATIGETQVEFTNYTVFHNTLSNVPKAVDFTLRVARGGEVRSVVLQRKEYVENCVYYADSTISARFLSDEGNPVWSQQSSANTIFDDDTAYIRLTSFMGQAYGQFVKAMSEMKARGKTKLIFDLRDNGGGRMNILCQIASHLCDAKNQSFPVSIARYKGGKEEIFTASSSVYAQYGLAKNGVVVLADDGSASASEAMIGAMLDYGTITREQLVISKNGESATTYGKGIMQTTFTHLNGQAIKLTTAKIFWPKSDTCIHGVGIGTVEENRIAPNRDNLPYTHQKDNELLRAVEILRK